MHVQNSPVLTVTLTPSMRRVPGAAVLQRAKLWAWGEGSSGALATGRGDDALLPTATGSEAVDLQPCSLAAGVSHVLAVDGGSQPQLWAWGAASGGRCAIDSYEPALYEATAVGRLDGGDALAAVAAGGSHSLLRTVSGRVFAFGFGAHGQLGLGGQLRDCTVPHELPAEEWDGEAVVGVSAGGSHSAAVTASGRLFCWGRSDNGRLGTGDDIARRPGEDYDFAGATRALHVSEMDGAAVTAVSCGGFHTLALTDARELYAWGGGRHGELGIGEELESWLPYPLPLLAGEVTAVSAGGLHSAALTADGGVYTWGWGGHGALGHGDESRELIPRRVMALDGAVAVEVVCGGAHTLARMADGSVYAWGNNASGELGTGSRKRSYTPQKVRLPDGYAAQRVWAGGRFSFALLREVATE
eukprot:PLAT4628.1.p1 GENE.PLAT4628.1~~PLAT4628.1.p1  ORF type:complete len:415 (+),score=138.13 PLAT4628.1:196-1440(+)